MATGKRYFWIKLKESFLTSDTVDFLMSQPNGAQYVVLYQVLCLKTINTDGRLARQIGEVIIPYDIEKIQRDCKWFSADTIRVAMNLFRKFGLIYEDVDGTLVMADHANLVGSETDWSEKKRRQRLQGGDNVPILVPQNVPIENRDKDTRDKDTRYQILDRENGAPSLEEIEAFAKERNSPVDPKRFFAYYEYSGWKDGHGNPIKNWKQKLVAWEGTERSSKPAGQKPQNIPEWDDEKATRQLERLRKKLEGEKVEDLC